MKKYFLLIFTLLFLFGCSTTTNSVIEDDEDVSSSSEKITLNKIYQSIEESATCTTRDSVAAYLCKFDHLPSNYVTKEKGITLYEEQGNTFSKWNFNPWTTIGVMIGGNDFLNKEKLLPTGFYREADLQYNASNRGTKRLIYQSDCVIYYTADHYKTFTQLFPKE